MTNKDKNLRRIFLSLIFFCLVLNISDIAFADSQLKIDFYYSKSCPHCHNVLDSKILDTVSANYNAKLTMYDVSTDSSKFLEIVDHYSKNDPKIIEVIPLVIIYSDNDKNGIVLQGDTPIITTLNETAKKVLDGNFTAANTTTAQTDNKNKLDKVTVFYVIITALSDSINPCIMSILALLLLQLNSMSDKKKIIKLAYVYILVVFLSYLIIGLLLYTGIDVMAKSLGVNRFGIYVNSIVFLLLLFGAIINIKDAFFYGKGITFSLPNFAKPKVEELARNMTLIAIVTLAFLITIVEFPCSGLMYVGIISLLVNHNVNFLMSLGYLIVYNTIFVLPLIFMVIAITTFNEKAEDIDAFRIKYRKVFRLAMGIVMLVLALYLLNGFILPYFG